MIRDEEENYVKKSGKGKKRGGRKGASPQTIKKGGGGK